MSTRTLMSLTAAACLAAAPGSAAILTYTDYASWAAAAGAFAFTEDFDGNATSFAANSTDNALSTDLTVDLIGGVGDTGLTGINGLGFIRGHLDATAPDDLALNFDFGGSYSAFALNGLQDDSSSPGDLAVNEIAILVGGETFIVSDILGLTNSATASSELSNANVNGAGTFVGFVSTTAVSGFGMAHTDTVLPVGAQGSWETFFLDQVIVAGDAGGAPAPDLSTVPVPAALPMLAAGLGLLGAMTARRRRSA